MFNTVNEYLDALKNEMQGVDSATMQDALTDAEEHLHAALKTVRECTTDFRQSCSTGFRQ